MPGRLTLTTTSRPSFSSARWIWAIDAVAIGSGSDPGEDAGPQLGLDHGLELGELDRGHLVGELVELLDVDVGEQVRPGGEDLAKLQIGHPELLEREPELDGALTRRRPVADDADLAQHPQEARPARDARHLERPLRPLRPQPHQG